MYRIFLIPLFFLASVSVHAQSNFLKGYVVTLEGDSIQGYVDFQDWVKSPSFVRFKSESLDSKVTKHLPENIKAFGLADLGVRYESHVAKVDVGRGASIADAPEGKEAKWESSPRFLKVLVSGKIDLLYHRGMTHTFYARVNGNVENLIYREYTDWVLTNYDIETTRMALKKDERYKRQLIYYFQDRKPSKKEVESLEYDVEAMVDFFRKQNGIRKNSSSKRESHEYSESATKVSYGLMAGANVLTVDFSGDPSWRLVQTDFSKTSAYEFGGFVEFTFLRNLGKWSWYNEFTYASMSQSGEYKLGDIVVGYKQGEADFEMSTLNVNSMVRYHVPFDKFSTFLTMGGGAFFPLSMKDGFSDTSSKRHEMRLDMASKFRMKLVAGLGAKYKRWGVSALYEQSQDLSKVQVVSATQKGMRFNLSYRLSAK